MVNRESPRIRLFVRRFAVAVAAAALAGCAGASAPDDPPAPARLSAAESRTLDARKDLRTHLPTYAEALVLFASPNPAEWERADRQLQLLERILERPLDADLRRQVRAGDPRARDEARAQLARAGRMLRHWLDLQPTDERLKHPKDEAELSQARRAYFGRMIEARKALLAMGDDGAALLIDSYLQWLPRATPDDQMILRDELEQCGPRVIPILRQLLDLPPTREAGPLRVQAMLVLARFAGLPEVQESMTRYAQTDHPDTRRMVAQALKTTYAGTADETPVPVLASLVRRDAVWEVRAAAADALGVIGSPGACAPLRDALRDDAWGTAEDRISALKFILAALGRLRCPDAAEEMIRAWERHPDDPEVARKAAWALHRSTGQYFATPAGWREHLARRRRE